MPVRLSKQARTSSKQRKTSHCPDACSQAFTQTALFDDHRLASILKCVLLHRNVTVLMWAVTECSQQQRQIEMQRLSLPGEWLPAVHTGPSVLWQCSGLLPLRPHLTMRNHSLRTNGDLNLAGMQLRKLQIPHQQATMLQEAL